MRSSEYITTQILYIVSMLLVVFQVIAVNRAVSILLMLTIILVYLLWGLTLYRDVTNRDVMLAGLILAAALNVFINAKMAGSNLSFSYIRKLLLFSTTLIFLQTVTKIRVVYRLEQMILNANTLLAVFLVLEYYIQGSKAFILNGIITHYLTFRFTNPNLTGMFLSAVTMLEIIRAIGEKKKSRMFFHILLVGMLFNLLNQTQTRNAMLSIGFFFVMLIISFFRHGDKFRIHPIAAIAIIVWPLIFVFIYISILRNPMLIRHLSFLVSAGKNLDSRVVIWGNAIIRFRSSPVFGAYYQMSHGTGMSQMHNTALDIIVSYGIFIYLAVLVFLFKLMTCRNEKKMTREQFHYLSGFSACLIMGMGEAGLFSGSLSFFVIAGLFLLLSGGGTEENRQDIDGKTDENSILV